MERRLQLKLQNRCRYGIIITKRPDGTHLETNWSLHKSNHTFEAPMPADWILSKLAWQCHRCHFKWGLNIYSFCSSLAYANPLYLPLVSGKCHLALPSSHSLSLTRTRRVSLSIKKKRTWISLKFLGHWLDNKLCQKCFQFGTI